MSILGIGFAQNNINQFNFKVDSVKSETSEIIQIPKKEMNITIKDIVLIISGYNIYMEEDKSTNLKLAQKLGDGKKNNNHTYYSSWLYYNNPSPDWNLIIYEYQNKSVKVIIENVAFITTFYCTNED
jgi:hypothetical protein